MDVNPQETKETGKAPELLVFPPPTPEEQAALDRLFARGALPPSRPRARMVGSAILPPGPKSIVDMLLEDRGEGE